MAKNKTLVIFNGFYLPHLGGVERYTAGLVSELKKDYNVVIVTSNASSQPTKETIDGVKIYRLDVHNLLKDRLPFLKHNARNKKIVSELLSLDITNVVCNTRYYGTTLLGLKIAKKKGLTPIIIDHSSDYISKPYEKYMLFRIKKYSPKYYTVSKKTADWLKNLNIKTEGIFYNSVAPQKDFKKQKSDTIRLVYAGRLLKEKGLDCIVQSFNDLKTKYNISLTIIGNGPMFDELKKNNPDIVFPGQLDHSEVLKCFKESDIFVYPTLYPEGFPTVILEAAMNKCVVVATDRGGTKELITDYSVGVILKKPEDLTIELEKLIKNKKRLRMIQENAFKKINEQFIWPKTGKIIKRALETTLPPQQKLNSTPKKAAIYFIIGIIITLFNFGLYTLIARLFIKDNNLLWVSSLIASPIAIILAFILHSRITWKERNPGKLGIYKFIAWNIIMSTAVGPFFTWFFSIITPLYEFAYSIISALHLPFDYDFIQSTGAFVLMAITTMIVNYIFYDKFVFGNTKEKEKKQ